MADLTTSSAIDTFMQAASASAARSALGLGTAATQASSAFATAAQGALADTATQPGSLGNAAAKNVGTTAGTVAAGDDSRLSDSRTPTAHATSHKSGGSDAIKLDELAAPTDITTLNATTSAHGLLPKLGGGTTNFLRADGSWAAPTGGTGGSTNLWIGAGEMIPRVTTGCSINSLESTTNKVNYDVLEFDSATAQYAQFSRVLPNNWNAGAITFKPHWTATSGSGDVVWGLQARAFANDDAIDQAFGTAQTSTDTLTAAADLDIGPASSAITIAGSPANGQLVIFQIYRDAAAGGDTLGTAAQLVGIEITFS